jgi:hypothetical protein
MKLFAISVFALAAAIYAQPPKGKDEQPTPEEAALVAGLKGTIKGTIVWSTSRNGNHDLYLMDADGTNTRPLTKGPKTDWYPRFSPDGKQVLFTRSKLDWTNEENGNVSERWDTWIINIDGTGEKLLIPNSSWATWRPDAKNIVFARDKDVYMCAADGTGEKKIVDGEKELKGGLAQNPNMSDDGQLLAVTLRGSQRETGVLNMKTRSWFKSGVGCQINFFPNSHKAFRVDETGIGMTRIFAFDMGPDGVHGKIDGGKIDGKSIELIDLPGRRSHEYFPKVSQKGDYLVWCATARGHDHDIADYEVHLWKIGTPYEKAVRLTFHSGNDRWPDIHLVY